MMLLSEKECNTCHAVKPIGDFPKTGHLGVRGYRGECKPCYSAKRAKRAADSTREACAHPGCGKPWTTKGYCGTHYRRLMRGTLDVVSRFDNPRAFGPRWRRLTDAALDYCNAETEAQYRAACFALSECARAWERYCDRTTTQEIEAELDRYLSTHGTLPGAVLDAA